MRGHGHLAGALEHDVEEAAGETTRALDTPDVQSTSPSKARMESPLTVMRSLLRSMTMILRESWARKS